MSNADENQDNPNDASEDASGDASDDEETQSGSFIDSLKKGVVNEFNSNDWEGFFVASLQIFIGVLIYGFVGANLTSILCWSTAEFDKGFPTDLDKPPYMGCLLYTSDAADE